MSAFEAAPRRDALVRRLRYAWPAGAALWGLWLLSVLLGGGSVDLAGQAVGTDFLEFYAAGYTVRLGQSAHLYDLGFQYALQQNLIGPQLGSYYAFITPPFLAWLFAPLSALPYGLSFLVWSLLGLLALRLGLRLLGVNAGWRPYLWSLTWFPIFACISYGQNGLLSLLLCCLVYRLWLRERCLAAGLVASLLLYKPQLLLGIGLLWLCEAAASVPWRRIAGGLADAHGGRAPAQRQAAGWRALAGLALGGLLLAAASAWLLPDASRAYITFAGTVLPDLPRWEQFPLWNLHTMRGFWRLLLPGLPLLAEGLWLALAAVAVAGFARFWRSECGQEATSHVPTDQGHSGGRPLLFAGAIAFTVCITPHAMIYDWALLLIPAVLLWQYVPEHRPAWQRAFAAVWLATFISGPLTYAQLHVLPVALQVSVPTLWLVLHRVSQQLQDRSSARTAL